MSTSSVLLLSICSSRLPSLYAEIFMKSLITSTELVIIDSESDEQISKVRMLAFLNKHDRLIYLAGIVNLTKYAWLCCANRSIERSRGKYYVYLLRLRLCLESSLEVRTRFFANLLLRCLKLEWNHASFSIPDLLQLTLQQWIECIHQAVSYHNDTPSTESHILILFISCSWFLAAQRSVTYKLTKGSLCAEGEFKANRLYA